MFAGTSISSFIGDLEGSIAMASIDLVRAAATRLFPNWNVLQGYKLLPCLGTVGLLPGLLRVSSFPVGGRAVSVPDGHGH